MKIAISGKGGVGKTTLAGVLTYYLAEKGNRVIAVDADPDANLASALGIDSTGIIPIAGMESLIEERTGAKPGTSGSFFKINPKVDDLPEKLWIEKGNIRLMVMGTVKKGGAGCICPESTLLKNLISHLVLFRNEVVILDMEAGIEHLGRAVASSVDVLIVVVEPGKRSIETAKHIKSLAEDIGIKNVSVVGNKIRKKSDEEFIIENLNGMQVLGFLPFDETLVESDITGIPVLEKYSKEAGKILDGIK
ncbi:MAG: AAA family ATPase [Spirochaetes bacterium]|nr:AAA family ATPase [Spirochaetota bacterium]